MIDPMDEIKYLENLNVEHYTDTRQYRWDRDRLWLAIGIVLQYNGEQNIRDGNAVSQEDIDAEISDIFDFRTGDMYQALYNEGHYEITQNMLWEKFQKDYKYVIDPANIKIVLIRRQLAEFRDAVYELEHTREIYYYIKTDQTLLYNKAYTSITDNELSLHQTIYANDRETVVSQGAFVFSEQYLNERNTAFLSAKQEVTRALIKIGAGLIVFLLSLAYLIYAAGKRAVSPEGVRHVFADRLYNEFTAAALFGAGLAVFGCIY
ncbi:MAG: hypothetical protein FWE80_07320, partial [Oscillospiraceae bacterium]|nr:hypothetical protein [Oscillospiraceae bacterium]